MSRNKGFTLIELLIVMAILGILAAFTYPSFMQWRDRSRVKGDATNLRAVFEKAKLRAIKHNCNAVVNFFPDNISYQAFVDTNNNGAFDGGETVLANAILTPGVTISDNTFTGNDMAFNPRGAANGPNSTGSITLQSPGGQQYRVVVSSFGRVRMERL